MNIETARIISLDSPNNYFLYIDFLKPLFPFPLLCFRKKREHCRERRKRRAALLFFILFYAVYQHSTSWPVSVTSTIISHWAEGFPSSVYTPQPSLSST